MMSERHSLVVVSRSEVSGASRVSVPAPEEREGLVRADGSINWECPCLGGMAAGPCGPAFREAFSCFHYSTAEPKGSECYDKFGAMQRCMADYPALYGDDQPDVIAGGGEEEEGGGDDVTETPTSAAGGEGGDNK